MKKKNLLITIAMLLVFNICFATTTQTTGVLPTSAQKTLYADSDHLVRGNEGIFWDDHESTTYASRQVTTYEIPSGIPTYIDSTGLTNTCAVNGGAVVVGYYNKNLNLIPGFNAGIQIGSMFRWNTQNALVQNTINRLYTLMRTDPGLNGGTSIDDYKNGLTSYAREHGYSTTITNRMTSNQLNTSQLIQSINNQRPVTVFLTNYNVFRKITTSAVGGTYIDTIDKTQYIGNHTFIVHGYMTIDYYNSSGNLIKQHQYLKVYTSMLESRDAYMKLNDGGSVDAAYEVFMY